MIGRLFRALRDLLDPVDPHAVMQTWRRTDERYDYSKARAGWLRSRAHSETGRPLPKPKTAAKPTANVTRFRKAGA